MTAVSSIKKIILATGWNCPNTLMQPLAEHLAAHFNAEVEWIDFYDQRYNDVFESHTSPITFDHPCLLVGWSLGGLVLNRLAKQQPNNIAALVTLATNSEFVNNKTGMNAATFSAFYQGFSDNATLTTKRFQGLVANSRDERKALKSLYSGFALEADVAQSRLKWLQDYQLQKINAPWYAILAGADNLVPKTAYTPLKHLADHVELIDESSHMFFHSNNAEHVETIAKKIVNYVENCCSSSTAG